MKQILPPVDPIAAICGKQKNVPGEWKPSFCCVRVPCEEGELFYHTLTMELLLLPRGETEESQREELFRRRFLVPVDFDEYRYVRQVRDTAALLREPKSSLDLCTIYPTTDCNARCYYCYELGRKRLAMSDQVAHDAAAYIAGRERSHHFKLFFFGGEPLFNRRAIDIITGDLRAQDIAFTSSMTTNGYLFDEETVSTAKQVWGLKRVQITLDGTEEVYNRSKAYIYREGSPFRRVLRNIGLLLDAGIKVSVRLNMDAQNCQDLFNLVQVLQAEFPQRENLNVYAALLRDFGGQHHAFATRDEQIEKYRSLKKSLVETGLFQPHYLIRKPSFEKCMAANDRAITILPDGRIGKCEHETEAHTIGSIYEDEIDQTAAKAWQEILEDPACKTCPIYPWCGVLKNCPWYDEGCTELYRAQERLYLEERILFSYEREKNRKNAADEADDNEELELH